MVTRLKRNTFTPAAIDLISLMVVFPPHRNQQRSAHRLFLLLQVMSNYQRMSLEKRCKASSEYELFLHINCRCLKTSSLFTIPTCLHVQVSRMRLRDGRPRPFPGSHDGTPPMGAWLLFAALLRVWPLDQSGGRDEGSRWQTHTGNGSSSCGGEVRSGCGSSFHLCLCASLTPLSPPDSQIPRHLVIRYLQQHPLSCRGNPARE